MVRLEDNRHYEVLHLNKIIDSVVYREQLERLGQAIERKRSALINRKCRFSPWWRSVTQIFDGSPIINRVWLGYFDAFTVQPRHNTYILPFITSLQKSVNGTSLVSWRTCGHHFIKFFNWKSQKFYWWWLRELILLDGLPFNPCNLPIQLWQKQYFLFQYIFTDWECVFYIQ